MNWLPAFGLALAIGAPLPKEPPKKAEPPGIVGEWQLIELVGGGRTATAKELSEVDWGIGFKEDGKFWFREVTATGPRVRDGAFTIDSAKDPAQVDYGIDKIVKWNHGIFKVEKDKLIMCVAEGGGERPTKFESPVGTRIMLLTFKRVEKKKD